MFQKHLQRVMERIHRCLASLPDDLPYAEQGARVKTEAMDAGDRTGWKEQRENAAYTRDLMIQKDAALGVLINAMSQRQ